jgi:magnesium transporter
VSLALQLLHGDRPSLRMIWNKLRRELQTGALLGAACGTAVAVVSLLWLRQPRVAACLMVSIAGGVACSALIGAAIPNLLRLFRRDPQVAAGPVSLAVADMVTLLFYFNLARWLFA